MRKRRNKRKGPDILIKSKEILIFSSWMLFLTIFTLFSLAKPGETAMLGKLYNVSSNYIWDNGKIKSAFFLMIILALICMIGLVINSQRLRRKSDNYSLTFIIFGIFSIFGVIVYPFI